MIVFELTFPNRGSWDGHWSGEKTKHVIIMTNNSIPKVTQEKIIDKDFWYNFGDGWCACVDVYKVDSREATKLRKANTGFCGYDWMVKSIILNGEIKHR